MMQPRFGVRRALLTFLSGVVLAGVAWGGYALFFGADATPAAPTPEPVAAQEKPRSDHPPIVKLRDSMLAEFHGAATHVFTAIPGFGYERMRPMYKKIPFDLPYLSTAELEINEAPKDVPLAIKPVLEKSLAAFVNPPQEKSTPAKREFPPFGAQENGLGHSIRGTIAHGVQLRMLDLVGLTDKDEPRVYSGGQAFEMVRMSFEESKKHRDDILKKINENSDKHLDNMLMLQLDQQDISDPADPPPALATRTLDSFEVMGVAELAQGKDVFIRHKGAVTRMLGALRAGESCLKCHTEAKQGDLLGAFSYTFVDTDKASRERLRK